MRCKAMRVGMEKAIDYFHVDEYKQDLRISGPFEQIEPLAVRCHISKLFL
jgi:hypothetical protein